MIQIKNLWKIYGTGSIKVKALQGVDLSIKEGEFISIIGPSGSGKSTLMNIIGCLDQSTSGEYILDGVDVQVLTDNELAKIRNKKIGFVFQAFNLLTRVPSIHNVEIPLIYGRLKVGLRKELALEAMKKVGLEDRLDHKSNELSGGQKQRVAIARAIVTNPAIILADEPTGNLDSESSKEIMDIFKKLNDEGATIIIVTHERDIAEKTKRIIYFRDGRIVGDELTELGKKNRNPNLK